jgi:glyoxylase-like metal-dependent hydrolase (beta-lactamase superfamily II)
MVSAAPRASIMVGDIRLTYLPDGETRLSPTAFFPASTEEGWKLHPEWLDGDGLLLASLGGLLVETGDRKVLIDTGFGPRHAEFPGFGPFDGGKLLQSLKEHGLEPGQIDTVVFTHLHLDHVNAAVRRDGEDWALAFPKARFLVRDNEWHHWVGKNDPAGMYEETELAIRDHVDLCDADTAVAPGVTLVSTPGHTPGHTSVVIASGTDRAIVLGDVLHCPVQLEEEEWGCVFDVDPDLARQTRDTLLAELEGSNTIAAGGHFSDFTFGRCMRGEGKRVWTVHQAMAGAG